LEVSGFGNEATATPQNEPPDAPSNLVATAGDSEVSLDWDDNTEGDFLEYRIYRATTGGGPYTEIDTETISSYLDGSTVNGTTYFYVVSAVDTSLDESGLSNEAQATPMFDPNQAPIVDAGADQMVAIAQASGSGFELFGSVTDDGLPNPPGAVSSLWTHFSGGGQHNFLDATQPNTLAQLDTLGTHVLRLTADDGAKTSFDDVTIEVVQNLTPPAPPQNLVAYPGDGRVLLDWDDNTEPDLVEYRVWISTTGGGPYAEVDVDDPSIFPVTGLTNGVTFFFVVTAIDETEFESGFSNEASATPQAGFGCTISAECDDGLFCNGVETCQFQVCVPGTSVDCDDGDFCTADSCNEALDVCDNLPGREPHTPSPDNGATGVSLNPLLSWQAANPPAGGGASPVQAGGAGIGPVGAQQPSTDWVRPAGDLRHECGLKSPEETVAAVQEAVEAGLVESSEDRLRWALAPATTLRGGAGAIGPLGPDDVFLYEDSEDVLRRFFFDGELFVLMFQAANDLVAVHGDQYDFICYSLSFEPTHEIGTAFYLQVFNDVSGLGNTTFDNRGDFGLSTNTIQGLVMMWEIDDWDSGAGSVADFTRLVLGQEFEHRFAMFLQPVVGGTLPLQGTTGCGRTSHWNFRVDGQGSGMEIREWIGTNPAVLGGACDALFAQLCFNEDTGGVFSYPDLYLMGYVSPQEMDAGMSQFRYMNTSDCQSPYSGAITNLASADIIAANGARLPDSTASQKDFRTAWIMIHPPGELPTAEQIARSVGVMDQHQDDWNASTQGRGTMNNSLDDPCPTTYDVVFGTDIPPTTPICDDTMDTFCDPGPLTSGTTYFWQVTATTPAGVNVGPVWSFTTVTDPIPPAAPTGLQSVAGDGQVSLDWNDNTEGDLAGYNVLRGTTSGGPYNQINGPLVATSDYLDLAVANGTTYFYVVVAEDAAGNTSGQSNEASATPQAVPVTMHVASIVVDTQPVGPKVKGRATVTIVDNVGNPVAGVTVSGTFTGSFNESGSDATDSSGVAVITTKRKVGGSVSFTFCVDNVTGGSLTYSPGDNVETCDSF
jgi:fibronectin type 3 domain-containing protein